MMVVKNPAWASDSECFSISSGSSGARKLE